MQQTGLTMPEDITKDLKQHNEDLSKPVNGIESKMNPFTQEVHDNLYCLTSWRRTLDSINYDLLNFIEKGVTRSTEFKEVCFKDGNRYNKPMPCRKSKYRTLLLHQLEPNFLSSRIYCRSKGTWDLFGRLLFISTMEKLPVIKFLNFHWHQCHFLWLILMQVLTTLRNKGWFTRLNPCC